LSKQSLYIALTCGLLCTVAVAQEFGPWGPPTNLGPVINLAGSNTQHPAISKDGLSLYISSDRQFQQQADGSFSDSFGGMDIWVSQRASVDDDWGIPKNLGPNINSSFNEAAPNLTTDGHWLYFHSNRPSLCGAADLYASHRQDKSDDFGWEPPVNLGCLINSPDPDNGPTFFEDETTGDAFLYFTRFNDPLAEQVCGQGNAGDYDIFVSKRGTDGTWGVAEPVCELSSSARDTRTAIRHDGLEMFISSQRAGFVPGGTLASCGPATQDRKPSGDLWVSTRATALDPWSKPVNIDHEYLDNGLPSVVNSPCFDGAPALSFDGTTLYFFSFRPRPDDPSWDVTKPTANLYVTVRSKLTGKKEGEP
jgi:hypothetical protein